MSERILESFPEYDPKYDDAIRHALKTCGDGELQAKMALQYLNLRQRVEAQADAVTLGTGWLRFHPDGTCERIDPERITVADDE